MNWEGAGMRTFLFFAAIAAVASDMEKLRVNAFINDLPDYLLPTTVTSR